MHMHSSAHSTVQQWQERGRREAEGPEGAPCAMYGAEKQRGQREAGGGEGMPLEKSNMIGCELVAGQALSFFAGS